MPFDRYFSFLRSNLPEIFSNNFFHRGQSLKNDRYSLPLTFPLPRVESIVRCRKTHDKRPCKRGLQLPRIALAKLYVFQSGLETSENRPFSVPVKDNEKSNSRSSSQRSNQSISLRKPSGVRIFLLPISWWNWAPFNPCNGTLNTFPRPRGNTEDIVDNSKNLFSPPNLARPWRRIQPPSSSPTLIQPIVVARSVSIPPRIF